jgi:hypothetical protein
MTFVVEFTIDGPPHGKGRTFQDELHDLLEYKNGDLFWKKRLSNRAPVGSKAGYMRKGYVNIGIQGKEYPAHSIIFCMFYGYVPKIVDHIDGTRNNNKIENLREATFNENARNCKKHSHNTSGYKGVSWDKNRNKWMAYITINNKFKSLGRFKTKEDAYEAYCIGAKKHFGEFARLA